MPARPQSSVLAVIPAYGLTELTRAVVADLVREPDAAVLVVDNGGDYAPTGAETVIRPDGNVGWLGACNLGLAHAARDGFAYALMLNNDTRLSHGFVAAMLAAHAAAPGLIAPVYDDDAVAAQHHPGGGPAGEFAGRAHERAVSVIDGTAVLVATATVAALGPLDARRFGLHGWGAMEDWCLRAGREGIAIHVTERAYVSHARGSTAAVVKGRYTHFAAAEMHYGLVRKWGRQWPAALPGSGHQPLPRFDLAQMVAWHWLERSGLATRLQRAPSGAAQAGQEPAAHPERDVQRDERD